MLNKFTGFIMKKRIILLLLAVCFSLPNVFSKEVNLEDAKKAAKNFYYERVNQYMDGIDLKDVKIASTFVRTDNNIPVYYAFDLANGGFVIISADDAYTPVIGYAFKGIYPTKPEYNFASFINTYVDMIKFARSNNLEATPEFRSEWDRLLTNNVNSLITVTDNKDVSPLTSGLWNQGYPYNVYCPADPQGPSGYTYAGCVATAMSMIMYYYRYPINGTGSHAYNPDPQYGVQSVNFGDTYYQWDGMQDIIDSHHPGPIAELQYQCGVSVNMGYGPDGSGAYSNIVPNSLNAFWRYNNAIYREKSSYSLATWKNLLKGDIDIGRPLYYSGRSPSVGHAFLCEGYQGDDFYFNFGWSGSGNGYFSLTNVGGYYIDQACIKNFYPSDANYPYHATGAHTILQRSGSFTDGSGPIDDYLDNQSASWLITPQTAVDTFRYITLMWTDFDLESGDFVRVYDGEDASAPLLGEYTGNTLPATVSSTGNQMFVIFETNGSGTAPGFKAEFLAAAPQWCSGLVDLTDPTGTFGDGSGDWNYANSSTCMWRIQPQFAGDITINFNYFETEEGKDQLKVFDGSTLVASLSGDDLPAPITATSGSLSLAWSSNTWKTFPGWEIFYEIDNVGVEEQSMEDLVVYPNPAKDQLNISFNANVNQTFELNLINLTGESIYTKRVENFSGIFDESIDLSGFAKGVYILSIQSQGQITTEKIVVQ